MFNIEIFLGYRLTKPLAYRLSSSQGFARMALHEGKKCLKVPYCGHEYLGIYIKEQPLDRKRIDVEILWLNAKLAELELSEHFDKEPIYLFSQLFIA